MPDSPAPSTEDSEQTRAAAWFEELRDRICAAFVALEDAHDGACRDEPAGRFERTEWKRQTTDGSDGGGGIMSIMRGRVFEKVGVNISTTHGKLSEQFSQEVEGAAENPDFWASGISLVAHMRSPHVPAVHMNTRHMRTAKMWWGGGADLTPIYPDEDDRQAFHARLKEACDKHDPDYYPKFSKWCDEYFYLEHRKEPRGVGGIFYDSHNTGDWEEDFSFTQDVGLAFLDAYPKLIARHMNKPWTQEERDYQLMRRGRYVEFNLLFDRGTQFGVRTGGNPEAYLMSLPPLVKWP